MVARDSDESIWVGVGIAAGATLLIGGAILAGVLLAQPEDRAETVDPVYGRVETLVLRF